MEHKLTKEDKIKIMLLANEYAYWSETVAYAFGDARDRAEYSRSRAKSELETYLDSLCKETK